MTPTYTWDWPYLQYIQEHLNKLTTGAIKRLMLFLPPRHGKSSMVTVRYPVWRLERDPGMRVIIGAYNQEFATEFSRVARKIALDRLDLAGDRAAAHDWKTVQGGGIRAAGVGSGVTGRGGDLIIIDDPVKSWEEANSEAYRRRVARWYDTDLYTRLEPDASIILIMTRWHQGDLAGYILEGESAADWTVISLPALAEDDDLLGRAPGQALCPERYDEADFERIQRVLGNRWWALYQQRPQPPEGDFFKSSWFKIVNAAPARGRCHWVRYWDFASSDKRGDFTAGVLMGLDKATGVYYVTDVVRGQWDSEERDQIVAQCAELDRQMCGSDYQVWREREGGSSGVDAARAFVKKLAGFPAFAEYVGNQGSKDTRAEPFQAQAMVENVMLVRGEWNRPYLDELAAFPFGAHDDQVDATTGAFRRCNALQKRAERDTGDEAPTAGQGRYITSGAASAPPSLRGQL